MKQKTKIIIAFAVCLAVLFGIIIFVKVKSQQNSNINIETKNTSHTPKVDINNNVPTPTLNTRISEDNVKTTPVSSFDAEVIETPIEEIKEDVEDAFDAWDIDVQNPPKSTKDVALLADEMTMEEVVKVLGKPNSTYGSGMDWPSYDLEDGRFLVIVYNLKSFKIETATIISKNDDDYEVIIGNE